MPIDMNEVVKALEVTADTVRGNGMMMCAHTIDWAVRQIKEALELQSSTQKVNEK